MAQIRFEAQDTLFFRDGRPFNQGEGTAATINSRFPPSPQTLVGSVRAAWARKMGWPGTGRWKESLLAGLGGDDEELTGISFSGPFLLKDDKPVFPAPALLIGKVDDDEKKPDSVLRLHPSPKSFACDLGPAVRLPVPEVIDKVEGRKLLQGWWMTQVGLTKLLAGGIPAKGDLLHEGCLWRKEARTGIQLNRERRTTEEGALYTTGHIRFCNKVSLALQVNKPPPGISLNQGLRMVLGGESRSAIISLTDGDIALPACPVLTPVDGIVRYIVVILSPMFPERKPEPGASLPGLPGSLVSACLLRAERWGGWDTNAKAPLTLYPHLAPGSVLFMEAEEKDLPEITGLHGQTIGKRRTWGFGLIAIGRWT